MKVTYINHMGTDLTVCDAARVSFDKKASGYTDEQNNKLISYLAKHNHWTPFGHPQVQLHVKAPVFVARQLGKHQVGMVWNEVSRRYVDSEPEFYWPDKWRGRPTDKKQGSSEVEIDTDEIFNNDPWHRYTPEGIVRQAHLTYQSLIRAGVAPEQARIILPQNTYTEWYWTGSLAAWSRVYNLRIKEDTQEETREIAKQIGEIILPLFPVSWEALCSVKSTT